MSAPAPPGVGSDCGGVGAGVVPAAGVAVATGNGATSSDGVGAAGELFDALVALVAFVWFVAFAVFACDALPFELPEGETTHAAAAQTTKASASDA